VHCRLLHSFPTRRSSDLTPEGLEMDYHMPAISGPKGAELVDSDKMEPLFSAPTWFQGVAAPRKLNTLIWSFIAGTVLYGFIRLRSEEHTSELQSRFDLVC